MKRIAKLEFDRALAGSAGKQVLLLVVMLLIAWGISFGLLELSGSDWRAFCEQENMPRWLFPLYMLIDSNAYSDFYNTMHGMDDHSMNMRAVLLIGGITYVIGVVIFSGMIISLLSNYVAMRIENHEKGQTYYLRSDHYIIMGYDAMVPSIILHIMRDDPEAYVLLQSSEDAETVRENLRRSAARTYVDQIVVNFGHRQSSEYYSDIHLESAKQVFVVGDHSKPYHDAVNVACVEEICDYLKAQPKRTLSRITCAFEDLDTYVSFCTTDIFAELTSSLNIEFVPYNFYIGWAKQVFVRAQYFSQAGGKLLNYPYVCGKGIASREDGHYVHLVFVGTSTFAVSFAREAVQVLHFPNSDGTKNRTRITFIDTHADSEMQQIMTRYRHLFDIQSYYYGDYTEAGDQTSVRKTDRLNPRLAQSDFLDVEFEFIKGDIFSSTVQDLLCTWQRDEKQYMSLFLAMSQQDKNFTIAMNLPDALYEHQTHEGWATPIFVRQDTTDNFVTRLRLVSERTPEGDKAVYRWIENGELKSEVRHGRYANLYPFGMNDMSFFLDELSLERAKLINYLYCHVDYETKLFPTIEALNAIPAADIWREANERWRTLPMALKWSNVYNANAMQYKLISLRAMRGLDCRDESLDGAPMKAAEISELSHVEHNRWNAEKVLMGYRKARPEEDKHVHKQFAAELQKNKAHYIHHDLRPYAELDMILKLDEEFTSHMPWIIQMTK